MSRHIILHFTYSLTRLLWCCVSCHCSQGFWQ